MNLQTSSLLNLSMNKNLLKISYVLIYLESLISIPSSIMVFGAGFTSGLSFSDNMYWITFLLFLPPFVWVGLIVLVLYLNRNFFLSKAKLSFIILLCVSAYFLRLLNLHLAIGVDPNFQSSYWLHGCITNCLLLAIIYFFLKKNTPDKLHRAILFLFIGLFAFVFQEGYASRIPFFFIISQVSPIIKCFALFLAAKELETFKEIETL